MWQKINYLPDIKFSSTRGFPGGLVGKRICLQCGRPGFDPWVGKIPWRRAGKPTSVFWPGAPPWTEEPGGLQSMGSARVGHDWATKLSIAQHSTKIPLLLISEIPSSTIVLGFWLLLSLCMPGEVCVCMCVFRAPVHAGKPWHFPAQVEQSYGCCDCRCVPGLESETGSFSCDRVKRAPCCPSIFQLLAAWQEDGMRQPPPELMRGTMDVEAATSLDFEKRFIYLSVLGPSCDMQAFSLWCAGFTAPRSVGSSFPYQGPNHCPLHWQGDSSPLDQQGSPQSGLWGNMRPS